MSTVNARNRTIQWDTLPDDLQLALAEQALLRAAETIAGQAERLATEMESGTLVDKGGPDAVRLLAAIIRSMSRERLGIHRH